MKDLNQYREFFQADRFATEAASCVIEEVSKNYAKCSMEIQGKHINGAGTVMGGAIFTLADFTFAVATNPCEAQTVTASSNITFLGKAKGKRLIATTRLVKDGKTTCLYEIDVDDELGNKIALVTSYGMKTGR